MLRPRPNRARRVALLLALAAAVAGPAAAAQDDGDRTPRSAAERLATAYTGLYHLLDGDGFEVRPKDPSAVASQLEARYGVGVTAVLRERALELDARMAAACERARTLLPSATDGVRRSTLLEEEAAMDLLRAEALALIEVYERKQQPQVDDNRKRVEKAYERYAGLAEVEFSFQAELPPAEAWKLVVLLRDGERTLDLVDEVLDERDELELERREHAAPEELFAEPGTYFEGAPAGLEDFPWLLLLFAAEQHVELLRRTDLLTRRIDVEPTPLERWLLRELRARSVDAFNGRCVHSGSENDAAFTPILNAYRRGLGLELLTVDERLLLASRQHSQHQVDNGYFSHDAPEARLRSPWDRIRLEDYEGTAAENLAQGTGGYPAKEAFEAWYRSPGHHRNMVGRHMEFGAATDRAERIWTLVLGRGDTRWRDWHPDVPPSERAAHGKELERLGRSFAKGKLKDRAWRDDVLPHLASFVDEVVRDVVRAGAEDDDGDRQRAIAAIDRLLGADTGLVCLECALVMQVLDFACESEDSGLRREAERVLRARVPGLAAELDVASARGGDWRAVRVAWEDRERVQFKARRSAS